MNHTLRDRYSHICTKSDTSGFVRQSVTAHMVQTTEKSHQVTPPLAIGSSPLKQAQVATQERTEPVRTASLTGGPDWVATGSLSVAMEPGGLE